MQSGGKTFLESLAKKDKSKSQYDFVDASNGNVDYAQINAVCDGDSECLSDANKLIFELSNLMKKNAAIFTGPVRPPMQHYGSSMHDLLKTAGVNDIAHVLDGSDEIKKHFQKSLRKYVETLSPGEQLITLQDMQNKFGNKFVLADPLRRPFMMGGGKDKPEYGFNDLYYFLSDHFENEMNLSKTSDNPFYTPILYPNDASTDQVLQMLIAESPFQKFMRMYDQYKNGKTAPEIYKDRLKNVYKVLTDPTHVSNPWYMTKYIDGQERPMESYRNDEFMATLSKFSRENASVPKPIVKKVQVNMDGSDAKSRV